MTNENATLGFSRRGTCLFTLSASCEGQRPVATGLARRTKACGYCRSFPTKENFVILSEAKDPSWFVLSISSILGSFFAFVAATVAREFCARLSVGAFDVGFCTSRLAFQSGAVAVVYRSSVTPLIPAKENSVILSEAKDPSSFFLPCLISNLNPRRPK